MRLAWFSPTPAVPDRSVIRPEDDTALLRRALQPQHQIDLFDERSAHDFVWQHARNPYDLCIYDLDDTAAHQFVWPYLVHYPGVTRLGRLTLHTSRASALEREQRLDDFASEFVFAHPGATPPVLYGAGRIAPGPWPMLAVPVHVSLVTVVPHQPIADMLSADYPGSRVRAITPGVEPLARRTHEVDVVTELGWPVAGAPLTHALAGLAAGRPVVVFDCPETADWPSLNPQDWQPRSRAEPICVAIDPRDETHSRRLAVRRLGADRELRARLSAAAREWWRAHATVDRASAAFDNVLEEAASSEPTPKPSGWPSHLREDGFTRAQEVLSAFGVDLPF